MSSAPETKAAEAANAGDAGLVNDIFKIYSPVNIVLTALILFLAYKIYSKFSKSPAEAAVAELPKLRKDMTVAELRQYDGTQPDGRVLVAVNGWIFDATRGRRFYGPGECTRCVAAYK